MVQAACMHPHSIAAYAPTRPGGVYPISRYLLSSLYISLLTSCTGKVECERGNESGYDKGALDWPRQKI